MRPKIVCHMMSSIDGRLLADRWTKPPADFDARGLRALYDEAVAKHKAEGWIVGRKTMEPYAKGVARASAKRSLDRRSTYVADRKGRDVAVDTHGRLHYGQDHAGGDHLIAILGEQVPDSYLGELREDGVSYVFASPDGEDLRRAMETLNESFGLTKLLLEGGGLINGSFLKAGLIDEISLLIYPGIDGLAGAPSTFEYVGDPDERPAEGLSLRQIATETLEGGMAWIRYVVEKAIDA
jgi:5-amino-6-(5-phosphoribosylamino)uracil reductase